ncbi:MAG: nitronate monooxygenase [Candidatus Aminicenantes bacterium]|nr:nitronate monooxygenase [Candidatus Aminicenantes bacterium]
MTIPELKIGTVTAAIPIVQGGMGVRVSLSSLAAAVTNAGGIGTLSSIGLGDFVDSLTEYERISREALEYEIEQVKKKTSGPVAINFMGVLSNVNDLIKTAVDRGIQIIVFGAGLPSSLPELVPDPSVNLVPIVSSARVAELILRVWDKRFKRTPDAVILEGPLAGGHLGFSREQLERLDEFSLERLLPGLLEVLKKYEDAYGRKIPVITGGGIYDGRDIARMLKLGASGVQMATRFVCTVECDVVDSFKQAYLDAKEEDIVIIESPVGMPGRALRNEFIKDLELRGKFPVQCPYRCLTACKADHANYCIAKVLLNSYLGDLKNGLIFCGQNAHRIDKIVTVKELFTELIAGLAAA